MTKAELYNILSETGYKVTSVRFKNAITPPYMCYELSNKRGIFANGVRVGEVVEFSIYFFKLKTDLESEKVLEEVFLKHNIAYSVDLQYQYVEDENIELLIYKFEDYQAKGV